MKKATLLQWKYFVCSVEKGSMLAAASVLETDVTQVGKEIRALEHVLGEPLLERSPSGVRPIWLGERKYVEAKALLSVLTNCFLNGAAKEPPLLLSELQFRQRSRDLFFDVWPNSKKEARRLAFVSNSKPICASATLNSKASI